MGRGVSAGGGQSSLGYLFGSGEAPKPPAVNAEAPAKQVPDTSSGPSQRSTATASPPSADVTKQIPAGIQGSQANNYFRADGQNCGNFITPWRYDVLLSFRGEDAPRRHQPTLPLPEGERSQCLHGSQSPKRRRHIISAHGLDQELPNLRGCPLEKLCWLDMLSRGTLECRNKYPGQMVLPVFYDVDPSTVRKQTCCIGVALAKHEEDKNKEVVACSRAALTEAAGLSGWDMTNSAKGSVCFICQD
ncbi:hypothetical protein CRG98_031858 [Punica granatum]|uniref:TIR domain-containing protein n=1 Tax=Punica granatum TaxID=22663 RepID=A0A2I0IUQ6_PUNGR|nr:hypothetical protein CRG98_031858 [Punica granatum]